MAKPGRFRACSAESPQPAMLQAAANRIQWASQRVAPGRGSEMERGAVRRMEGAGELTDCGWRVPGSLLVAGGGVLREAAG